VSRIRLKLLKAPKPFHEDDYKKRLEKLQLRMLAIQQAYFHEKRRAIVVFEGWDAAGKGGAIRRVTEELDPRGVRVWPIGAPAAEEQGRHYLYRFWTRLPEPGTLAIFDRSWYGRVLVERVEDLIGKGAWKRAYDEINKFEKMLIDDGVRLVKIFLYITPEEQLRRFADRLRDPSKRWKLTDDDIRNRDRWDSYVEAAEDMFEETSKKRTPWTVIQADLKWVARVKALEAITETLAHGVNLTPPPIDAKIRRFAETYLRKKLKKKN
jgi:polyphosphate kinase 2 (PPK2 family)